MLKDYNFYKKDKVIGILEYDTESKNFYFKKLSKDIKDYPTPFFFRRSFDKPVPSNVLYNYLEERVIDKNNVRVNDILDYMGLVKWDLYEILKFTLGRTDRDSFWIDFSNELKEGNIKYQ